MEPRDIALKIALGRLEDSYKEIGLWWADTFPFYGRTVKEPAVGWPLLAVLLKGSCAGSVAVASPHWIEMLKVNVSPTCDCVNV